MRRTKVKLFSFALLMVALMVVVPVALAGNDFVVGELRVDLPSVTTGQYLNYRHYVYPAVAPNNPNGDFTTAWFGIDLAQFNGDTYSAQFTQVGVFTQQSQGRWFVYAEPGVECWRGTPHWIGGDDVTRGCLGGFGDLDVVPGDSAWTRVEAVTYAGQNWWILRVYDKNFVAHDVAKVASGSKQIFWAQSTSEEGYGGASDPHILMSFYHYHPEYWKSGVGFTLWPASSGGNNNHIWTWPAGICPDWYGAQSGIQGNPHLWRTASGDPECTVNPLF